MSISKHIVTGVAGAVGVTAIVTALAFQNQFPRAEARTHQAARVDSQTPAKPIRNVMVQPFSATAEPAAREPAAREPVTREPAPRAQTQAAADTAREPGEAYAAADVADGLSLSRQRWQRGGYGSQALLTFTVTNRNAFAVKDIQLSCAFTTPDGSYTTSRTRVIRDTIRTGRKRFEHALVGFVTAQVSDGKCEVVGASRA